jgi:hypothetical protein
MTAKVSKRLGLLVVACLAVAALVAALWPPRSPVYAGQPLPFWFKRLPMLSVPDPSARITYQFDLYGVPGAPVRDITKSREALAALRAMGTNALPFLIRKLEQPSARSRFAKLAQRYGGKLPLVQRYFPSDLQRHVEQQQSVAGLLALCPLPPDTVLRLRTLSLDFKGGAWGLAGDVLRADNNTNVLREALRPYE